MVKINKRAYPFYLLTLLYFALGFVNILFAYLAIFCMAIPFIMVARTGKKPWCSTYCPRADYLAFFRLFDTGMKAPDWLNTDRTRKMILQYFCINVLFIVLSTLMVYKGEFTPVDYVRFLIVFQIPFHLPQLLNGPVLPDWIIHLAYRFYSIMFTSTVLGMVLALLYRPRTWCGVCPVNTVSTFMLRQYRYSQGE